MTKLLAGKISTLLAALTTSFTLSGCETATSGRPEVCKTNSKAAGCVRQKIVKPKVVKAKSRVSKIHHDKPAVRSDY